MLRMSGGDELLGLALGVVGIADVSRGVWVSRSSEGMTGGRASPAGQERVDQPDDLAANLENSQLLQLATQISKKIARCAAPRRSYNKFCKILVEPKSQAPAEVDRREF